jgi:hypothetical protein
MITKTLPAFKHTSIGAKTHKARTATAHVSYIMRSDAMSKFQAGNMPDGGRGTRVFFDKLWGQEGMPEKARIADKFMIALPLELSPEQRREAVRSFMESLGKGRIAWCAAHHDQGEDAHNPHAHIVFKDADIDTGKKVIGTTTSARDVREAIQHGWKVPPRMTTKDLRHAWCDHLNRAMERAGLDIRFDARTYKERGIDRESGIHIGPKAQALAEKGYTFESHDLQRGEQIGRQTIPYSEIDAGSRVDHNHRIGAANDERARAQAEARKSTYAIPREDAEKRELREAQGRTRKDLYEQQRLDRQALRQAHQAERRRHDSFGKHLYAEARKRAFDATREQMNVQWQEARALKTAKERSLSMKELKAAQKALYVTLSSAEIERARPAKNAAYQALLAAQDKERTGLREHHRKVSSAAARQQIAEQLGIHEKWRAVHLERQTNRVDARLSGHQGMAAQQRAADAQVKLHARASFIKGPHGRIPVPQNPREATRLYFEAARNEQASHIALRESLDRDRARNLERADPFGFNAAARGEFRRGRSTADGAQSPREALSPALAAAKENRSPVPDRRDRETGRVPLIAAERGRPDSGRSGGGRGR